MPKKTSVSEMEHAAPKYNEVYQALVPFTRMMWLVGLFPIANNSINDDDQSLVNGLKFRWQPKLLIPTVLAIFSILGYVYFSLWHYSLLMPDSMESFVTSILAGIGALSSSVNLYAMVTRAAPNWSSYFHQYQKLDRRLNIMGDNVLSSYVKTISRSYAIIIISLMVTVVLMVIFKYSNFNGDDYTGHGYSFGAMCYVIHVLGCQYLPELLFTCFCVAIKVRLLHMKKQIQDLLEISAMKVTKFNVNYDLEISEDLERFRISYHCLTNIITSTNGIMGTIFLVCVLSNASLLSSVLYLTLFSSHANVGMQLMKVLMSIVFIARLMSTCIFAESIKTEMKKFKRLLHQIRVSELRFSPRSCEEFTLLLKIMKNSRVTFTAFGFFKVDKDLLNTVSGAVLSYTITILQFSKGFNKEMECPTYD